MDETTQTPPVAGAPEPQAAPPAVPASAPVLSEEQRLLRLLRNLLKGLVGAVAIFAVIYFFGQRQSHVEQAPPVLDQTIASAEAAVRSKPDDLNIRTMLAAAYAGAERFDDAKKQLQEILRVDPKFMPALLGIGDVAFQQSDFEAAKTALTKYVAIADKGEFAVADKELQRADYILAFSEMKLGDAKSAVLHFSKALAINSGDADAWFQLGLAQNELSQFADAALSFRKALAFVPTGWCEPYAGLAKAYSGAGDSKGSDFANAMVRVCGGGGLDSAAPLLGLTHTTFAADALFGLGTAAENDHDNVQALHYYQQVLSLDRTNVAALTAIARLNATPAPEQIPGE